MSQAQLATSLLRFTTAGSVDDGKSTLIGRLLYDNNAILDDQLAAIKSQSSDDIDLARLTDGLRAEREQGITIDVAYRYFTTGTRKFIIADSPGHIEYTRNMITAASNSELAVVLVDASKGIIEQTRRHIYLASLLGLSHLVVCVNKMDLVDYSAAAFNRIKLELNALKSRLRFNQIKLIPLSAYHGDNVVTPSTRMPWYKGPTLIKHLQNVSPSSEDTAAYARFPIQYVIRADRQDKTKGENDYARGYAGKIASGSFEPGDAVMVLPGLRKSRIKRIVKFDGELSEGQSGDSVVIVLADELDVGRGDVLVKATQPAYLSSKVRATLCWLDQSALVRGRTYLLKQSTQLLRARVDTIDDTVDINTLDRVKASDDTTLNLNQIGSARLVLSDALVFDSYASNRALGSFILIDESTHATAAAGLLLEPDFTGEQ
jgi:sulfate adenylyltransferase large subunit